MDPRQAGNETTRADFELEQRAGQDAAFSPGEVVADRFRIVRKVGEGGMGIVYEAVDLKLGERRALKFAKARYSGQIPPEARSALRVTHDNICRIYEIHTAEGGTPSVDFISMEFIEGETLQDRCARGPVSQAEALVIAKQLCDGLEAAHRAQILHRDLKGNNVMLNRRPDGSLRVVIMDFGLAKFAIEGALPATSDLAGTPNYIAPERWKGAPATPASDMYALGVILYDMLSGRLPFDLDVSMNVRLKSLPQAPSKVRRDLDTRWDPIVLGCLYPSPEKRISSPGEVRRLIERAFAISHRRQWIAATLGMMLAAASAFYFRDTLFPPPPIGRLAILPFTLSAASPPGSELNITLRGSLSDVAGRLAVLGAASRRLVIISPEEVQNYKVDSPSLAATRLRATHALLGEMEARGPITVLHATITELKTGNILRRFDGEFRPEELSSVSTSLAGVVTSAFHLGSAPSPSVLPQAYSEYARGLAVLRRDVSSYDDAISHFDAAQKIDPRSSLVLAGLVEAYSQKFKATLDSQWLQKATEVAERAESLYPDSVLVLLALSSIEQTEGHPERAVERLRRANELDPSNSEVWRQMGAALDSAARDDEAIAAFRKSIQLAPDYFRPHRELGTLYFRRSRFAEAIEEYRAVTQLVPELAEGHSDLGAAFVAAGRENEAETELRQSVNLRETYKALNNLGVSLRYQKRDAEAVPILVRALTAGPDDASIRLNLGNALRRLDRIAEARENFQRANDLTRAALLLNPRDAAARARLAYSMAHLGNPVLAEDEALQAIKLAGSDYATLYWTIMTLVSLGKSSEAYGLLGHASSQQLKDLARQPDLDKFANDARFPRTSLPTQGERITNGRD
jgi:serine/threonine protein kinase/Flp pilus assembly protein TadD